MVSSVRVVMVLFALIAVSIGFGGSAYALGKHAPKPPKVHRHAKNTNPYAYLGAKKIKSPYAYLGQKPKKHGR